MSSYINTFSCTPKPFHRKNRLILACAMLLQTLARWRSLLVSLSGLFDKKIKGKIFKISRSHLKSLNKLHLTTPRQSVTHAHWILGSPRKTNMLKLCSLLEFLAQVSCKLFLKFQVGIISLGALFHESRVNTKSPFHFIPMDLLQLRSISSTAAKRRV